MSAPSSERAVLPVFAAGSAVAVPAVARLGRRARTHPGGGR